MPKFFAEGPGADGFLYIAGGEANHVRNVLRLKPGDKINVNVSGEDFICEIDAFTERGVRLVRSENPDARGQSGEPRVKVTLFAALLKGDKTELAVQKCVELGVHEIRPIITERVIARAEPGNYGNKTERYNKVSLAAAKQCGRGAVPKVYSPVSLSEAVKFSENTDVRFCAHEKERERKIKDIIKINPDSAAVFIGPEGGFTDSEVSFMAGRGILAAGLGNRVLRAETAAIAALIIFLYETEGN